MDAMNEMQQYLVEDHIHGLEHEAERLRAERERDRRTVETATARGTAASPGLAATPSPASAAFAVAPVTIDSLPSARVRLGRWLVGVGAAIAGATLDETETETAVRSPAAAPAGAAFAAIKSAHGPCDDGSSKLSHAA